MTVAMAALRVPSSSAQMMMSEKGDGYPIVEEEEEGPLSTYIIPSDLRVTCHDVDKLVGKASRHS